MVEHVIVGMVTHGRTSHCGEWSHMVEQGIVGNGHTWQNMMWFVLGVVAEWSKLLVAVPWPVWCDLY